MKDNKPALNSLFPSSGNILEELFKTIQRDTKIPRTTLERIQKAVTKALAAMQQNPQQQDSKPPDIEAMRRAVANTLAAIQQQPQQQCAKPPDLGSAIRYIRRYYEKFPALAPSRFVRRVLYGKEDTAPGEFL